RFSPAVEIAGVHIRRRAYARARNRRKHCHLYYRSLGYASAAALPRCRPHRPGPITQPATEPSGAGLRARRFQRSRHAGRLTLALGIGENTAIFTVVHSVLLAPLPYPDADRIVAVQSRNLQQNLQGQGFAPAGFRDLEKQVASFESIAAYRYNYDNLTHVEKPTSVTGGLVTQDYFRVLGEKALIGRTFTREDATANAKPTVLLSYDFW